MPRSRLDSCARKTTQRERKYYEGENGICAPEIRSETQAPCQTRKKKLSPITVRNLPNTKQNADAACKTELNESRTYSTGAGPRQSDRSTDPAERGGSSWRERQ